MNEITLDKEEQKILHSFERGEWKSVPNVKEEIEKHRNYARKTLKKNKRVNIRISHDDRICRMAYTPLSNMYYVRLYS